jgi:hypothetical protein
MCRGGQFYELTVGYDRFNADLRPHSYRLRGQHGGLCCHPYDCAALLIAEEAGVILTDGTGAPLDGPRHVWWNFVSSQRERIQQAKEDWRAGRFALPPDDHDEFIPLPEVPKTVSYP